MYAEQTDERESIDLTSAQYIELKRHLAGALGFLPRREPAACPIPPLPPAAPSSLREDTPAPKGDQHSEEARLQRAVIDELEHMVSTYNLTLILTAIKDVQKDGSPLWPAEAFVKTILEAQWLQKLTTEAIDEAKEHFCIEIEEMRQASAAFQEHYPR